MSNLYPAFQIKMARGDSNSSFSVTEELTLIPRWSIVLGFVSFVGIQYLFFFVLHTHYHSPFPVHVYFGASWGALVAVYMLMIGYISEDAPRRSGCSADRSCGRFRGKCRSSAIPGRRTGDSN